MKEETKEEYLARHRKEQGIDDLVEVEEEAGEIQPVTLIARLKSIGFLLLLGAFLWIILQIFGMLKSN